MRRQIGKAVLLLATALAMSGSSLAGAAQKKPTSKINQGLWHEYPAAQVEQGQRLFVKNCSFCHGVDANGGDGGPNLMRSSVVRHDNRGDKIGPVILNGFPDKGMPAFQLSSEQIMAIVAFLRYRLDQSDRRSPAEMSAEYSGAKLLVGNAQAGKAFFYGAGKCSSCHSPTGDLAGIAKKYEPAELQALFLYPQPRHQRPTATVTDSSGQQFTGPIRLLTPYDVAIIDGAGWYRSWPKQSVKIKIDDRLKTHRQLLFKFRDAEIHNMLAYLETLK